MRKIIIPMNAISAIINISNALNIALNNLLSTKNFIPNALYNTPHYLMYYYTNSNFQCDLRYFLDVDLDADPIGFAPVKRNIRFSIEAFLNLFNLIYFHKYEDVLDFKSSKNQSDSFSALDKNIKKYATRNNDFTLFSKLQMAQSISNNCCKSMLDILDTVINRKNKSYGSNGLTLEEVNKYVHCDINIIFNDYDAEIKLKSAKNLLILELQLTFNSLFLLHSIVHKCDIYNYSWNIPEYGYPVNLFGLFNEATLSIRNATTICTDNLLPHLITL